MDTFFRKEILPNTEKPDERSTLEIPNGKWVAEVQLYDHSSALHEGSYPDDTRMQMVGEWGTRHDKRTMLVVEDDVEPAEHHTHYRLLGQDGHVKRYEANLLLVADKPFSVLVYRETGETDIYTRHYFNFTLVRARQVHKGELGHKAKILGQGAFITAWVNGETALAKYLKRRNGDYDVVPMVP